MQVERKHNPIPHFISVHNVVVLIDRSGCAHTCSCFLDGHMYQKFHGLVAYSDVLFPGMLARYLRWSGADGISRKHSLVCACFPTRENINYEFFTSGDHGSKIRLIKGVCDVRGKS